MIPANNNTSNLQIFRREIKISRCHIRVFLDLYLRRHLSNNKKGKRTANLQRKTPSIVSYFINCVWTKKKKKKNLTFT